MHILLSFRNEVCLSLKFSLHYQQIKKQPLYRFGRSNSGPQKTIFKFSFSVVILQEIS